MANVEDILEDLRRSPTGARFADLCKVCDYYFGEARQAGGSHRVYKTQWAGDPRVNFQNTHGMAKSYQVKQVLKAIKRLEGEGGKDKR